MSDAAGAGARDTGGTASGAETGAPTYTAGFWVGVVIGMPIVAYGLRGVLDQLPGVQLTSFARWFLGGAVLHDVLLAPAVCAIGWAVARWLPRPAVAPVQAALVTTAIVALVSWPLVRGYGITPGEPSFLSRDYTASLLGVLAAVWAATVVAIAVRVVMARRR